jgi:hypothetical protein
MDSSTGRLVGNKKRNKKMQKKKREPKRLMRQIEKITAKYVRMHPALWGLSKEDLFNRAF